MLERLLNTTLRFSIARRWLIVAAAIVISLWGLLAVSKLQPAQAVAVATAEASVVAMAEERAVETAVVKA